MYILNVYIYKCVCYPKSPNDKYWHKCLCVMIMMMTTLPPPLPSSLDSKPKFSLCSGPLPKYSVAIRL